MPPARDEQANQDGDGQRENAHHQQEREIARGDGRMCEQRRWKSALADAGWPPAETLVHVNRQRVEQAESEQAWRS